MAAFLECQIRFKGIKTNRRMMDSLEQGCQILRHLKYCADTLNILKILKTSEGFF